MNDRSLARENMPLTKPSPVLMANYVVGGHHDVAIDRAAADQMMRADAGAAQLIRVDPTVGRCVEFDTSVVVLQAFPLQVVTYGEDASGLVCVARGAAGPGSYLIISHRSLDTYPSEIVSQIQALHAHLTHPGKRRRRKQSTAFFEGLSLVKPGGGSPAVVATWWSPGPLPYAASTVFTRRGKGKNQCKWLPQADGH